MSEPTSSEEPGLIVVESRYHNGDQGETTYHLVGEFPRRVVFTNDLFESFNPELVQVDGDEVAITLSEAHATYRIVERREHMADVVCELVPEEASRG